MEVKIGVQFGTRELVIESDQSAEQIEAAVAASLGKGGGLFTLTDAKGRRVIVPADKLAYVEVDEPSDRPVGFGRM